MIRNIALIILAFVLTACYDKDDYTLTEPRVAAILSLATANDATSLPADGVSRLTLIARISAEADRDRRTVEFTASAGKLIGGTGSTDLVREVPATADGRATIELQSDAKVQAVSVNARIKGVDGVVVEKVIQFVPVNPDDIIRFTSAPVSAPADGLTISRLAVIVSPVATSRQVEFKTTLGTFLPSNSTMATVPVLTDNTATISLKSSSTIGFAEVTATLAGVTRQTTIEFTAIMPDNIIQFVSAPTSAEADGATLTPFTVRVAPTLVGQQVKFTTDQSVFATSNATTIDVSVQTDFTATARLKSPSAVGPVNLMATINGVTRSSSIIFTRALPDRVVAGVSQFSVPAKDDSHITVTATTSRDVGTVTKDTAISFQAVDKDGKPVGSFRNSPAFTDATGKAAAEFFPGAGATKGPATITVREEESEKSGSVIVDIVPP